MVANQELVKSLRRQFIVQGYGGLTKAEKIALIDEQAILIDEQAILIDEQANRIAELELKLVKHGVTVKQYQLDCDGLHASIDVLLAENRAKDNRIAELEAQVEQLING